jgi:hypothetical protein
MIKYEVTLPLVVQKYFFLFFKHLNNIHFQITQNLVVLNITNPFFTCSRQQISSNLGVSKFLEYSCYFLSFNLIEFLRAYRK